MTQLAGNITTRAEPEMPVTDVAESDTSHLLAQLTVQPAATCATWTPSSPVRKSAPKQGKRGHCMFYLRDTLLFHESQNLCARRVLDRYGRTIGYVRDLLMVQRSFEDAVREDRDPHAWTAQPVAAVVGVGNRLLSQLRSRMVLIPIEELVADGNALRTGEDAEEIRRTLKACSSRTPRSGHGLSEDWVRSTA